MRYEDFFHICFVTNLLMKQKKTQRIAPWSSLGFDCKENGHGKLQNDSFPRSEIFYPLKKEKNSCRRRTTYPTIGKCSSALRSGPRSGPHHGRDVWGRGCRVAQKFVGHLLCSIALPPLVINFSPLFVNHNFFQKKNR
jgi:hypothetical protein